MANFRPEQVANISPESVTKFPPESWPNMLRNTQHNGIEFRHRYLAALDNAAAWVTTAKPIVFDFTNVKKIGPSFANEAFGYFTKYVKPQEFYKRVQFINISDVQRMIIDEELESGYKGR